MFILNTMANLISMCSRRSVDPFQTSYWTNISIDWFLQSWLKTGRLDINDSKLKLKIYITNRSITLDEKIGTPKKNKMMIPRRTQSTTNASKLLDCRQVTRIMCSIIFLPIKQDLSLYLRKKDTNIALTQCCKYENRYLETNITKRKNKRQKEYPCVWALVPYFLKQRFSLQSNLKCGFCYIRKEWNKRPRLRKIELQEYTKLINKYIAILNKKSNTTSKISNIEPVESMTELLEIIMI